MRQISLLVCLVLMDCIFGSCSWNLLVCIYHLPHFKRLPEHTPVRVQDALFCNRKAMSCKAVSWKAEIHALKYVHVFLLSLHILTDGSFPSAGTRPLSTAIP